MLMLEIQNKNRNSWHVPLTNCGIRAVTICILTSSECSNITQQDSYALVVTHTSLVFVGGKSLRSTSNCYKTLSLICFKTLRKDRGRESNKYLDRVE